ncbi:UDP-4-amino-4,6-dideoxy-N-acetyl-beta-L-altrosamine N-acetyltransferase [Marinobacter gudaonensis]|uniref:UDP-4-amino-4,6-dideoxy-N-acetyl-beta-L-altrosamine N-acetyltransferase n=1 Tax=Marinobacter gudaonensis TaxID=375760 RepID=A0A1I6GJC0_9GAMM|nr:UDP-4-amino-4,6-dideoxy-N-acetyl-beta-L-altrosamine N-acetyltransferase [Marinobacter gudaonensis]SFR42239.1 UDP-4-amino-4,6-dideoxy-N-acetyl-beta-L-altrosamine N-acetyltransferase [Marinobacter gudaonensis]
MAASVGNLRAMTANDLVPVLAWRNHESVRRFMYTQHEISPAEHRRWFKRCEQDSNRHLLIYEEGKQPLGFMNITVAGDSRIADWGFYNAPEAPKGTGGRLGRLALHYSFDTLGLHKLCGQALAYNEGSIRFHEKLGFTREGVLRQQHFDGNRYHDIVCFGLLKHEWDKNR